MAHPFETLADTIQQFAATTPAETTILLVDELCKLTRRDGNEIRAQLIALAATPALRHRIANLIVAWQTHAPEMDGAAIALALLTAHETTLTQRSAQSIDLVWTGPDSRVIPLRRTDQALLQIIHETKTKLLIVSFAVYKIPTIVTAIVQAIQRGVSVSICVESSEASGGKIAYDTWRAFGEEVRLLARFYIWSASQRQSSTEGKQGSLHAKVAVADESAMLISSANLTEYALNLNMEMGVLIRHGELPLLVEKHFESLIAQKVFEPVLFT
jgi:phosphatidylserine/phosphatidylglycerophosphate/cardiolipin synthase-like enzyme